MVTFSRTWTGPTSPQQPRLGRLSKERGGSTLPASTQSRRMLQTAVTKTDSTRATRENTHHIPQAFSLLPVHRPTRGGDVSANCALSKEQLRHLSPQGTTQNAPPAQHRSSFSWRENIVRAATALCLVPVLQFFFFFIYSRRVMEGWMPWRRSREILHAEHWWLLPPRHSSGTAG